MKALPSKGSGKTVAEEPQTVITADRIAAKIAARDQSRLAGRHSAVATGGDGTQPPGMDPRVDGLIEEMKDVKAVLARMEPLLIRIDERTSALATKADLQAVTGSVNTLNATVAAQDKRLVAAEKAISDTVAVALSKSLGAGSIVGMVAGIAAITAALVGAVAWTLHHFNLG